MGRFFFLLVGVLVGGGAIYGAFTYHLVKADSGFELVPKRSANLGDAYVDIRKFTPADWAAHPALAADIMAAQKQQLFGGAVQNPVEGAVQNVINDFQRR